MEDRCRLRRLWAGSSYHWDTRTGPCLDAQPPPEGWVVLGAWNPGSRATDLRANFRADADLRQKLQALGVQPRRVVGGRDPWWEDFWAGPLDLPAACRLLQGFGQAAGLVWLAGALHLLWPEGIVEPCEPPPPCGGLSH